MQKVNAISLIKIQEAIDLSSAQSEIMLRGICTGVIMPGHGLEAAIQVIDQRDILFLTDNIISTNYRQLSLLIFTIS